MIGVEGVPGAGVIGISAPVRLKEVIGFVLQSTEAERRTKLIALRGVVVHNVQNYLYACAVKGFDHVAEFVHRTERILPRTVGAMRREKRYGRISPVVHATHGCISGVELENRHQLYRCDPKIRQVGDFFDQSGEGAGRLGLHGRTWMTSEATNMQLVYYGLDEWPLERQVTLPVIGTRICCDGLHCTFSLVCKAVVCLRDGDRSTIGIQQNLIYIEAQSALRLEWAKSSEGIDLTRGQVRYKDVPVVIGAVLARRQGNDSLWFDRILTIEQQQFHQGRVL
jgi:hypothetical protein